MWAMMTTVTAAAYQQARRCCDVVLAAGFYRVAGPSGLPARRHRQAETAYQEADDHHSGHTRANA